MAGLTQPLEFRKHLRRPPRSGFDVIPFLDALLIALFIALNGSAFILAPGTAIQLPGSATLQSSQALPTAVLTVDRNELYFFEGRKLANLNLENRLREFIDDLVPEEKGSGAILLLKADATITSESLFQLMDKARRAGFTQIHLAAEPAAGQQSPWDESANEPGP